MYWLSGLTCTDENFIAKSGAQRAAAKEGIALIVPDTSPSKSAAHFQSKSEFIFWNYGVNSIVPDALVKLVKKK